MRRPSFDNFGYSMRTYALGLIFFVPLSIGILLVTTNASQNDHANQISRDVASMYSQGMDFSRSSNQAIALRVAEGLGMNRDQGVVILSKIRVVHDPDCGSPEKCVNRGQAVVTQRYVIGNRGLRSSSFGTPGNIDPATGDIPNWANDVTARAQEFPDKLKPGELIYAAECYLVSPESRAGVYSRVLF